MARQSKRETRADQRRAEVAIKLLALGAAFAVVPLFFRSSPFGKGLSVLVPFGLVLIVIGGVMLWLGRQLSSVAQQAGDPVGLRAAGRKDPGMGTGRLPVERTATELERSAVGAEPLRPTTWSPAVFDVIEWRRFEALVETLFQQAGFETKSQPHGADEGIDVWLYSRSHPEAPVSIVQCKHWSGKRVGVDKIRELRGVMAAKNVRRGQFATTSTFTPDAVTFARDNGINLLDVDGLLALIGQRTAEQQADLLAVATEGEYWRPTCVNCGVKMVDRTPRKGGNGFWGCANYPRCKTMMQMRGA